MAQRRIVEHLATYPAQMKTSDVADALGVSVLVVTNWLKAGQVPGYKVGGRWFVLRDELADYLLAQANQLRQESAG